MGSRARGLANMWVGLALREWFGWDNMGPRAEDVPWHYQRAVLFIRANKGEITAERVRCHRALYRALLEKSLRGLKRELLGGGCRGSGWIGGV